MVVHFSMIIYIQGTINEEYATSYTYGNSVKLPTEVTRDGYTFAGWYTNSNYDGSEYDEISPTDFGNKTFYAKWTRKSYSVTVDYNRMMGYVDGTDIYSHGDVAKLRAKADAGFEFVSWSCDDEAILKEVSPYDSTLVITVVRPVSLTATFKMKESIYTVGELRIDTLKTDTEIMPIELSTLFQSSENGEIFYVATSTSPNVILPQIEAGKLFLATFGVQGKATITVVGKLANGARATLSCETVVEYNCNIQVSAEITNTSCFGTRDGGISLSAEHEYTYKWMGLDNTTMRVEGLDAGNYSVEISDERGCKEIETYVVTQPDEIVAVIDTVVPFSCDKASEIRLKADGEYTYLWSDGSTAKDLIGAKVGDYTVTVTNPTTNCSVQLAQSIELPFKKPEISLVTVSKETGKNLIVWVRENTDKIDYYTIYRETTVGGEFKAIGTVKYTEISVFEDDDPQVDPQNRSWSYKISATDFCGNETELSDMHSTIHLSQPDSHREGYVDLSWNPYVGVDYSSYIIICETTIDSYTFVDTVTTLPSSLESYSAVVPPIGKSVFYIGIKLGQVIDPKGFLKAESGPFALAISNIAEVESIDNNVAISNTAMSKVEVYTIGHTIYVKNPDNLETTVYDISGHKLAIPQARDKFEISVKLDGVYFVKVGDKQFKVVVK